jgi:hypothetical protein
LELRFDRTCPLCDEEISVQHIIQDCKYFRDDHAKLKLEHFSFEGKLYNEIVLKEALELVTRIFHHFDPVIQQ